jgi:hypothetical protein
MDARSPHHALYLVALATGALLGACGGKAHYEGGVYRDPVTAFRVETPGPEYDRLDGIGASGLSWAGPGGAMLQVKARCDRSLDIPLRALMGHLLIGFTELETLSEALVPMDGREALERHVRAKVDGVPRELLLRVLKKDGCVYDLALVAPPGASFERARPGYSRMVESFGTR